jgi:hypothetical protein
MPGTDWAGSTAIVVAATTTDNPNVLALLIRAFIEIVAATEPAAPSF